MKNTALLLIMSLSLLACSDDQDEIKGTETETETEIEPEPTITTFDGYSLVWSDEFNGAEIDPTIWGYNIGDGTGEAAGKGWGNNELQKYTNKAVNSSIAVDDDGTSSLLITALKQTTDTDNTYTSARLTTETLKSIRYGKIVVRAKMPKGKGFLPAIWLLGDNRPEIKWPGCGEIDMAEVIGSAPETMFSTLHYVNGDFSYQLEHQSGVSLTSDNFSDAYHEFTLDWDETSLAYSLDGVEYFYQTISDDMQEYNRSFNLILNLAVGGNLPGKPDDTTVFPQNMYVDYVRVYQHTDVTFAPAPLVEEGSETLGGPIYYTLANLFNSDFTLFSNSELITYGPASPEVTNADMSIDGEQSLLWDFPGNSWGGGYLVLDEPLDMSSYTNLVFSIKRPEGLADIELKVESVSANTSLRLADYIPVELTDGFVKYTIPLSDFIDVEFTQLTVPFALWNPVDADGGNVAASIIIDNLLYE
jgi:beta-glucanase (GH16 family)